LRGIGQRPAHLRNVGQASSLHAYPATRVDQICILDLAEKLEDPLPPQVDATIREDYARERGALRDLPASPASCHADGAAISATLEDLIWDEQREEPHASQVKRVAEGLKHLTAISDRACLERPVRSSTMVLNRRGMKSGERRIAKISIAGATTLALE
jgi:hypothetical protein